MPLKNDVPTEYTAGGTPINRGWFRRLNKMILLTICCTLLVFLIIVSMVVFSILPILSPVQGNQTKYQVQSDAFILIYNLPDRYHLRPMNWTYHIGDFEIDQISLLQKLLQEQLNREKSTNKTTLLIVAATVIDRNVSSLNAMYPFTINHGINSSSITLYQSQNDSRNNSRTQLEIKVKLRYALLCGKKCQNRLQASAFVDKFHGLTMSMNHFRKLLIDEISNTSDEFSSTPHPCLVQISPIQTVSSTAVVVDYEAESSLNRFIATTIRFCSICSNKEKVSQIGFAGELTFESIFSKYGGSTLIVFHYLTDRLRFAQISINNQHPPMNLTFPIVSSRKYVASLPILINLCQGLNSIRIFNPYDYAPEFDRIQVY